MTQTWEERFDNEFDAPFAQWTPHAMKKFIESEINKAREQVLEELISKIQVATSRASFDGLDANSISDVMWETIKEFKKDL